MSVNFGNVGFDADANAWRIACEPHVRARLRRVFPRVPQGATETIVLAATPENTRELEWFLSRYPMTVGHADHLRDLAAQHEEQELRIADLLGDHVPPPDIELAEPPRDYQRKVPPFLQLRHGIILADDLGVGKTVSGICCLVADGALPAIVVVPAHLPKQWETAFRRFTPALTTHVIRKSTPYSLTEAPKRRNRQQAELLPRKAPDVLIVSYHKLRGWAETLVDFARTVVFEEVQALCHPDSLIYAAAKHVSAGARDRLGLSATPINGYGAEYYNVYEVLSPGALGERDEFLREWCVPAPGGKSKLRDPVLFGAWLRREGLLLARTRRDVGRELPPVSKIVHEIDADPSVLDALESNAIALARRVLKHNEAYRGERMQASSEFDMLLRQATGLAKAPYVVEFVKLLLASEERVVVFAWHRAVYDILLEGLKEFNPVMYTGSESPSQKDKSKTEFVEHRSRVMLISLRSGSGLDGLQQHCRTVVFAELDWSASVHTQGIGRVDRDGQPDPVAAYFLTTEYGSDPILMEVLGIKREQSEGVRLAEQPLVERIDTGQNNIRALAKAYLSHLGLPEEEESQLVPTATTDRIACEA